MIEKQDLFEARRNGYWIYRIPGLAVTTNNVVLVTTEARPGQGGDYDFNDVLMPNSPSTGGSGLSWCGSAAVEDWGFRDGNTNTMIYQTNLMAGYMSSQLGVYRCPADIVPSDNGQRIRTYSMQGQIGSTLTYGNQAYAKSYLKMGGITSDPGPSDLIVFLEESGVDLGNSSGITCESLRVTRHAIIKTCAQCKQKIAVDHSIVGVSSAVHAEHAHRQLIRGVDCA